MTDYKELVKALRCLRDDMDCYESGCPYLEKPEALQLCDWKRLDLDAATVIEQLRSRIDELEEKQTYCDAYGDKWMTSAKDVPTAAYKHGYADGRDEAEAQLPKRGKWVEDTTTYAGPGLSNYKCSLCGKIGGTWRRGLKPSELPNWCGNCGADMRKMEVQDG